MVPTASMANLIAVMLQCGKEFECIIGDKSHIYAYEGGSIAKIGGVTYRVAANANDGTIPIESIAAELRRDTLYGHMTYTSLVCIEDTQNICGGVTLP